METMSIAKFSKSVEYCTNLSEKIDKDLIDLKSQLKLIVKKFENLNKLHEYSQLDYNWNFNGAEPFAKEVINLCWERINELEIQPEIFPTACGSIQFEYEKDNKDYLEFEIYQDRIEVFKIINGNEEEFDVNASDDLNNIVNEFFYDQNER